MARMTVDQLISKLPSEHQKDVRAKAKKINTARAKARQEAKPRRQRPSPAETHQI